MARSLGITKLIKTSVKDDLNVSTVFSYLAQSYMHCILSQVSGMDSHDPYIDPMMMNEANSMHAPLYSHLQHSPTNNKSSQQQQHHNQQKSLISNGHSNNNKKGSSDNNHQIALLNGNNKSNNKTGKSLFRNPIILKSSQPIIGTQQQSTPTTPSPPPNINNNNHNNSNNNNSGGGGFGGFFSSSKTKQSNYNNLPQNNNYQQHAQHQNMFHRNNRSNKYPANMLPPPVALINGQMMHRPSPYAPFINGHGGLAGRDPRHWNDNIPFRLDLVKDRKRRKETSSCTIL